MASNDVDIMSQIHTFESEIKVDVLKPENRLPTNTNGISSTRRHSSPLKTNDLNGEITKSVPVSAGKRRKVVQDISSDPPIRRTTRFGNERPPPIASTKRRSISKPVSMEDIKEKSRSIRTKKLQETFQEHDSKVRELFHLTKFVSFVDYDPKAAKEDESEVFKEVSLSYLYIINS